MVRQVAVIADSIACIPKELLEQYGISIIPLNFYANGRVFRDGIDVTAAEAYKLFLQDPESFKTSSASPGDCLEAYQRAAREGKDILSILLSAKLSALHSTASAAGAQVRAEFPGISVIVMDSETAAAAEGLIAMAAARVAREGKDIKAVVSVAEQVRAKVSVIAYMDTVKYVYRSGRIPRLASVAGSMLKIRPMFTLAGGMPHFVGAVRNKKVGIERLLETMREKVGNNPVHVAVMHVYAEDDAIQLKERVAREFSCAELWLTEFSSLMGYACGTGTLGLAFYPDDGK